MATPALLIVPLDPRAGCQELLRGAAQRRRAVPGFGRRRGPAAGGALRGERADARGGGGGAGERRGATGGRDMAAGEQAGALPGAAHGRVGDHAGRVFCARERHLLQLRGRLRAGAHDSRLIHNPPAADDRAHEPVFFPAEHPLRLRARSGCCCGALGMFFGSILPQIR